MAINNLNWLKFFLGKELRKNLDWKKITSALQEAGVSRGNHLYPMKYTYLNPSIRYSAVIVRGVSGGPHEAKTRQPLGQRFGVVFPGGFPRPSYFIYPPRILPFIFACANNSFILLFIYLLYLFTYAPYLFTYLYPYLFNYLFIYLYIYLFTYAFIYLLALFMCLIYLI